MQLEIATQSAGTDEEAEAFFVCGGWRRNAMCQRLRLHRNIPTSAGCLIRRGDCAQDVLADATLDVGEKRAILVMGPDACTVESVPALRKPPGAKAPIAFEEIMDALWPKPPRRPPPRRRLIVPTERRRAWSATSSSSRCRVSA
jgi:hypothetical protein